MSQISLLKNKRVAIVILVELNAQNGFQARSDWHLVRPLDVSHCYQFGNRYTHISEKILYNLGHTRV